MNANALAELGRSLPARAAGLWRIEGDALVQVAFWAATDLPDDVAEGFSLATRRVALSETGLGIVRAATQGCPCVSIARDLPPDSGSGLWLRRFGADRSVAVGRKRDGAVVAVASVALTDGPVSDEEAARRIELLFAFEDDKDESATLGPGRADPTGEQ